ncbi:unnamed protein product [Linum trigynum]|uniref:Uncharacterized protein n=1 Tax=Linum trigynum TaxID=586398 RepID=A0AAV2E3X4_9ROSI
MAHAPDRTTTMILYTCVVNRCCCGCSPASRCSVLQATDELKMYAGEQEGEEDWQPRRRKKEGMAGDEIRSRIHAGSGGERTGYRERAGRL